MSKHEDINSEENSQHQDPFQDFDDLEDLPSSYDETQLTFIARDPHTIHAYWDISSDQMEEMQEEYQDEWDEAKCVLRVHDMDNSNVDHSSDTEVGFDKQNWYVNVENDDASFYGEIGIETPDHGFVPICESNSVTIPRREMSERTDLMWMDPQTAPEQGIYAEVEHIQEFREPQAEPEIAPEPEFHNVTEEQVEAPPEPTRHLELPKVENCLPPNVKTNFEPIHEIHQENVDIQALKEEQQEYMLHGKPFDVLHQNEDISNNTENVEFSDEMPSSIKDILETSLKPSAYVEEEYKQEESHNIEEAEKVNLNQDVMDIYYSSASPEINKLAARNKRDYSSQPSISEIISKKQHKLYQFKELDKGEKKAYYQKMMIGASELWLQGASKEFAGGSEQVHRQDDFFFELNAELVVTGRTEPNARVRLGYEQVKLNEDGTFTLHFSLPDGKIPLEFVAESNDQLKHRAIKTSVERHKTTYY